MHFVGVFSQVGMPVGEDDQLEFDSLAKVSAKKEAVVAEVVCTIVAESFEVALVATVVGN